MNKDLFQINKVDEKLHLSPCRSWGPTEGLRLHRGHCTALQLPLHLHSPLEEEEEEGAEPRRTWGCHQGEGGAVESGSLQLDTRHTTVSQTH